MTHDPVAWVADLRIDPTVFLAPGAVVVGDVRIGARASVWFNTVVRGDTAPVRIGADTNIQDNSVVHVDEGMPAEIGDRVTVGHRAIVHGCVIEDDCLIGMGAVVLSGVRLGRGSLVAAGALVREGQNVPPGSLVMGAPAQVKGVVGAAHREAIERGARHYVELSRSYLRRGFAQSHPARHGDAGKSAATRGAMTWLEWDQSLAVLSESPARAARALDAADAERLRRAPQPGRWCALEIVGHLFDSDREVFAPRLERMLAEGEPRFEFVDLARHGADRHHRDADPARLLAEWSGFRRSLVARLESLDARSWPVLAYHETLGPYPIAEMVRSWVEHDLGHLRQLREALAGSS